MSMLYGELTAPTAVTLAVTAHVRAPAEQNLIVAKSSLLQIFRVRTSVRETQLRTAHAGGRSALGDAVAATMLGDDGGDDFMGDDSQVQLLRQETVGQLVLVEEVQMSGSIAGMVNLGPLQNIAGDLDCVAISFLDAKVSIVFWDSPLHSLTTLSIHFYEREAYRSVFSETPTCNLFKDHHNRCLILRFNTDVFAILPLRQSDDDIDETFDTQDLTPYYPSFIVQASQLEESIAHILDQAFLYEYREPTLAILFSGTRTATGLLALKNDTVTLMAVTLDLQQRASTTIFSVQGMPYDCFRVLPLPQPVGGLLVLGVNQVIHVDQAGRCTAIGVNAYAPKSTNLQMIHRPELKLKLEGAVPVLLGNDEGDVLIGLRDSTFIRLRFIKDGRNVTDIELERVDVSGSPAVRTAGYSCAVTMESSRIFLGSSTADSVLLGYTVADKAVDRGGVSVGMNDVVDDLEDIYGDDEEEGTVAISGDQGKLRLRIHDSLFSTAPIRDATLGTPAFSDNAKFLHKDVTSAQELLAVTNCDTASSISIFRKSIIPSVIARLPTPSFISFTGLRTKPAKGPESAIPAEVDRYLLASRKNESIVYRVTNVFEEVRGSEFDRSGGTIAAGTLLSGTLWAQVVSGEIRVYDHEIRLHQLIPITDEEFGDHSRVRSATIADPFILLVLESERVVLYETDPKTKDIDVHPKMDVIEGEFTCGCVFQGKRVDFLPQKVVPRVDGVGAGTTSLKRKRDAEDEDEDLYGDPDAKRKHRAEPEDSGTMEFAPQTNGSVAASGDELEWLMFLVSENGDLQIRRVADMEVLFTCDDFAALPKVLCPQVDLQGGKKASMAIEEILVANLGDSHVEPYLLVRTELNDTIIYKPFQCASPTATETSLRFTKIPNPHMTREPLDVPSKDDDTSLSPTRMFALPAVSGYAAVFVCGSYPGFILKTSHSIAKFHRLVGPSVRSICPFNVTSGEGRFLYYDSTGIIRICELPSEFNFDGRWGVKRVSREKDVSHLQPIEQHGLYAISCNVEEDFLVADDEGVPKEVPEDPLEFLPTALTSSLELINSVTWKTVDTFQLGKYEVIMCLKQVSLQISEETKARRPFLVMGTATLRGEDAGVKGNLYVFDIAQVVPQPGRPDTNRKLRLAWSEETRGAVTVVNEVRGYLLASQGQKVMVRSYGETDKEFLPIAFFDLSMVVAVAESVRDFVLFGDIMHSICFIGFQEEPYRMTLLGKDYEKMEVSCGNFVIQGENLFFAVGDGEKNLHVFQYDPENPQSLSGNRLIRRADIHVGHFLTQILRARRLSPGQSLEEAPDAFLGLTTSRDGNLGFISAINERVYRRLNILQGQIINNEEQSAALNPRAYRLSTYEGKISNPAKGILDRDVLLQFSQLSGQRRSEYAKKSGISVARLLDDLVDIERSLSYM